VRPLDLAALRGNIPYEQQLYSSRSNISAAERSPLVGGWDTPRSWVTAASIASALPQTSAEIEALDTEEVARLAEEAEDLQQRASKALQLAKARLLRSEGHKGDNNNWRFLVGRTLLQVATLFLAALILVLSLMNGAVEAVSAALKIKKQSGHGHVDAGWSTGLYCALGNAAGFVETVTANRRRI